MRIPLAVLLIVSTLGVARAASELEQKLELAREADDTHAEIELLRRWLAANPNDAAAVEELVTLWLEVPDYEMALQTLKSTPSPDAGLVARTDAEVAWRRDENQQEALKILRKRLLAAPKDRDSQLMLADYLAKAGERREQIAVLDALIAEESDFDLLLDRADAKLAMDDPRGALTDFHNAASGAPDESRVKNAQPGFERLEVALEKTSALDKQQESPSGHLQKSYWWFYGGLPQRGLSEAVAGLQAWPDSALGKILETKGLVANGSLDSSKARQERHVDISANLDDEKGRQSILLADADLSKKPGDPAVLARRASWLDAMGQYLLAMDDVEAVLKVDPSNILALHIAVASSLRLGNFPAATAYAQRLENLKAPKAVLSDVFCGLAQMAFEQSNLPLALDFAERSLAAQPTATVWKLKAACHTRLGQTNEAADALKKAEKGSR